MMNKDTNQKKKRSECLNEEEILILEKYAVKFYNSFNSAVIFIPSKYWGSKVNVYKIKEK